MIIVDVCGSCLCNEAHFAHCLSLYSLYISEDCFHRTFGFSMFSNIYYYTGFILFWFRDSRIISGNFLPTVGSKIQEHRCKQNYNLFQVIDTLYRYISNSAFTCSKLYTFIYLFLE